MSSISSFERRFNDWRLIHPTSEQIGTDEKIFLSEQVGRVVKAQLEGANQILVRQQDIEWEIHKVNQGIEKMSGAIQDFQATFEWGFTELIWQIEQTNVLLQEILQVLQAPLDTQAKELRRKGEDAYRNGWFDDSLKDFLESEKRNRYDFTIHHYLGNIYLFHKKNPTKALEYYNKAVKYAAPKSLYHASFSLLHLGLIYYLQQKFQQAYESTMKAIKLSPDFYEAHYQHAHYCAKIGKFDEAVHHLRMAVVEGDPYYCIKADSEKDFDVMKKQLINLFFKLKEDTYNQLVKLANKTENLLGFAESFKLHGQKIPQSDIIEVKEVLDNIRQNYLKRDSYLGYIEAVQKTKNILTTCAKSIGNNLSNFIHDSEKTIRYSEGSLKPWDNADKWIFLIFIWSFISVGFGYLLHFFIDFNIYVLFLYIFLFYLIGGKVASESLHLLDKRKATRIIEEEQNKINSFKEGESRLEKIVETC